LTTARIKRRRPRVRATFVTREGRRISLGHVLSGIRDDGKLIGCSVKPLMRSHAEWFFVEVEDVGARVLQHAAKGTSVAIGVSVYVARTGNRKLNRPDALV
jgi:hypothetical protein